MMPQTNGDVLPVDSGVGRFITLLVLALQDSIVARRLYLDAADKRDDYAGFFLARLSIAQFHEAMQAINRAEKDADVSAFMKKVASSARDSLRGAKRVHQSHHDAISQIRNQAFHFPSQATQQADGWEEIREMLVSLSDHPFELPQGKLKDARFSFAEHIAVGRLYSAAGDSSAASPDPEDPAFPKRFRDLIEVVATAIGDLSTFTGHALDLAVDEGGNRYLARTDQAPS